MVARKSRVCQLTFRDVRFTAGWSLGSENDCLDATYRAKARMNLFQDKIAAWLSRTGPDRSLNQCFDLPIVLGTDVGLQRSENQDRVGALRIGSKTTGGRPLIAIAVVDGMGGMRDGGACATLAL